MITNPDKIPGWFDFKGIYEAAVERAPKDSPSTFVEIGTAFGRSAAVMATLIRASGKPIQFYTIDSFVTHDPGVVRHLRYCIDDLKMGRTFEELTRSQLAGFPEAQLIVGVSYEVAARFADDSVDFLFIDGDHELEGMRKDLAAWLPKMRPGATLGGHDWGAAGVNIAVRELFGDRYTLDWGSWLTTRL